MASEPRAPALDARALPRDEELLAFLKESVGEVFSTMICSFREAAMGALDADDAHAADIGVAGGAVERAQLDREAVVEFHGAVSGAVVLRCSAGGALDIARGLLMLDDSEAIALDEVNDALGECANMVGGSLKTKALDPRGDFRLGTPTIGATADRREGASCGRLVYKLAKGAISLEIWRND